MSRGLGQRERQIVATLQRWAHPKDKDLAMSKSDRLLIRAEPSLRQQIRKAYPG
jgi:hypothetical protein